MAIKFNSIFMKNFLSVGDIGMTIYLDRSPMTCITGTNGVGKTAIIVESLNYALFGKPYRDIKKHGLVNTTNQKNCEVKLTFTRGVDEFIVHRGMKPEVFDIYKNGEAISVESSIKDMQKVLEERILGFDAPSFIRTTLLSSMNYTPFMRLNTGERRRLVESLLDIQVFSNMNTVNKVNLSNVQDSINRYVEQIDRLRTNRGDLASILEDMLTRNEDKVEPVKEVARALNERLKREKDIAVSMNTEYQEIVQKLIDTPDPAELIAEITEEISKMKADVRMKSQTLNFLSTRDTCPSCLQKVEHEHSSYHSLQLESELENLEKQITSKESRLEGLKAVHSDRTQMIQKKREITQHVTRLSESIVQGKAELKSILLKISDMANSKNEDTSAIRENISRISVEIDTLEDLKFKQESRKKVLQSAAVLLKDDGIKSTIINQYLPILISYTNKYLSALNFSVTFDMTTDFDVVLKTRFANEFSYHNLSAGEKQRIDLALAFAWRQVSKMKNSVNVNILVLDEILDSQLDANGTDDTMALMAEVCQDENVFIISHKTFLTDMAQSAINLVKVDGFTKIS